MKVPGLLAVCLLLVACSAQTTGNVVKTKDLVRDCKIENFICYAMSGTDHDITLDISNHLEYEIDSGSITLLTTDCTIAQPTVALDSMPQGGDMIITFTCKEPVPPSIDGTFVVKYTAANGAEASSKGTLTYRAAVE